MFRTILAVLLLCESASAVLHGNSTSPSDTRSLVKVSSTFPNLDPGKSSICGGVLISPSALITAAHCVYNNEVGATQIILTLNDFHPKAPNKVSIRLSIAADIHRGFSEFVNGDPDLAIVYLPRPIQCRSKNGAEVARLPPEVVKKVGQRFARSLITDLEIVEASCFALGWGITEEGSFAEAPQVIYLTVIKDEWHGLMGYPVGNRTRACQGDSGSPVFCEIRSKEYLIGIITNIGSFNKVEPLPDGNVNCKMYDFVVISDIRTNAGEIARMLKARGQNQQLVVGQKNCRKTV